MNTRHVYMDTFFLAPPVLLGSICPISDESEGPRDLPTCSPQWLLLDQCLVFPLPPVRRLTASYGALRTTVSTESKRKALLSHLDSAAASKSLTILHFPGMSR